MKDRSLRARRIVAVITLLTLGAALAYAGVGAVQILQAGPATSFPWYTSFVLAGLYFGPVLILELVFYLLLRLKSRGSQD